MRKIVVNSLTFLIIVSFSLSFLSAISTVHSEVAQSGYSMGDTRKYSLDSHVSGLGMLGTLTFGVTGVSNEISYSGTDYECYEISSYGSGTVYGQNITGLWTITAKDYYVKQSQGYLQSSSTTDFTYTLFSTSHHLTQTITTSYNPPLGADSEQTLSAGASWSAVSTKTTTTATTLDGNTTQKTGSEALNNNYFVLRTESTTVSAGTFDTFVIKETDFDGSSFEYYYSPKVGFDVRELSYDSSGTLEATIEMLEYNYSGGTTTDPLVYLILMWIAVIAVAGGIVGYAVLHKRRNIPQNQPSAIPTQSWRQKCSHKHTLPIAEPHQ